MEQASNPERAEKLHLAHSGSQSQRGIWFILPADGASHIIKNISTMLVILSFLDEVLLGIILKKYLSVLMHMDLQRTTFS